ncbi:uncharacterized protein CMU_040440 [Cryptosporidium muris RN66]|uniref:F-box domain-containing protein n=1 Tax=Cryptosporidium muris (strain RN66) TaxID=441375 RepID=B6A9T4_CRYMR|nr:uncharacterized protein CMU_040440 [Cryptosporidium muris RN66]EEA04975.1 hypothetical protein, conserved [Cryptosporidium muris RN66]|eukprot:XP_002139324.1 hypothetical protein [Cryptosporidium muris RN66]
MNIVQILIFLFFGFIAQGKSLQNNSSTDSVERQWEFIVTSLQTSPHVRCRNLTNKAPKLFWKDQDIEEVSKVSNKTQLFEDNCFKNIKSLLDLHLPKNKRRFSFKFSNTSKIDLLLRKFCSETADKYYMIIHNTDNPVSSPTYEKLIEDSPKSPENNKYKDSFEEGLEKKLKHKNLYLDRSETSVFPEVIPSPEIPESIRREMRNQESSSPFIVFPSPSTDESYIGQKMEYSNTPAEHSANDYSLFLEESALKDNSQKFTDQSSDIDIAAEITSSEVSEKAPRILKVLLRSSLEDIRDQLPQADVAAVQVPRDIQERILSFMRSKDIESIVELLSRQKRHVVESFLDSLEQEIKRIRRIKKSNIEFTTQLPQFDEEWSAIVEFMSESVSPIQCEIRDRKNKGSIKPPKEFKFSNGIEKKFIQYCRRAIRALAYEKYVSEDGTTYYGYNENNKYGILIAGNDSEDRKQQVQAFCYMVYNRLYSKREKELTIRRHAKMLEMKKAWEEGAEQGKIIDELLGGFTDEINDERLQWLYLVNSASVPNPLVYSVDLPKHSVPVSFTQKSTDSVLEVTSKIQVFTFNCRIALMTLGIEKHPGTKFPLHKVQLGYDGINGLIKFCKSVSQRYVGRLVEWFNILQTSLNDEIISLIDTNKPEFRCPEYFEYEDDSRLVENCSKTIQTMLEDNKRSEKKGLQSTWPGLKIKCPPNQIIQHIRSFCKAVAFERPDIRIATIRELSGEEQTALDVKSNVSNEQTDAIEQVEKRLQILELKQTEDIGMATYKLDRWSQAEEKLVENRRIREKIDKYSRHYLQRLVDIEDNYKQTILGTLSRGDSDGGIKFEQTREKIQELLDQYISDFLSMRTEWSDLIYQISNNNRKITEVEMGLLRFVREALDYVAVSHRAELANSISIINMINWENELNIKEKEYINLKLEEYVLRLNKEHKIQDLRDIHFKRRQSFERELYHLLPRKFWKNINTLGRKGLYPIIPITISEKELQERKVTILKLQEEKTNLVSIFDKETQKLNRQLLVIDKVTQKHFEELNDIWDNTYSVDYAMQWEFRIKDMQEAYIQLNNEYKQYGELVTRQQLRQSQVKSSHPQYNQIIKETSEAIDMATEEMKKLLKLMEELRQKTNDLDALVEADMTRSYSQKIETLRKNTKLLEEQIKKEIDILQKENEIMQMQLSRDIKYYEITNHRVALAERKKKLEGLTESNLWLKSQDEQLTINFEERFRDDLLSLTYSPKNKGDYDKEAKNEDNLPEGAINEIKKFRENLKMILLRVDSYNENIYENDLSQVQEFEKLDILTLSAKESFEAEGALDDGIFYNDLSNIEWNFIQSRWKLLKLKFYFLQKKEAILKEGLDLRTNTDKLMLKKYGLVPTTKTKIIPSKSERLIMKGFGLDIETRLDLDQEERTLSYDEKVLKLVSRRLEDANVVFEQELTTRLEILDEKILEGKVRLQEAARDVVASWEKQQSTAAFRYASPQNKDRMRDTFEKKYSAVTKEEKKKTRPYILEKHVLLQQQKDRASQSKMDKDWLFTSGRTANQLIKFQQKKMVFEKKRHDIYEKTLEFLIYQAEKLDKIREIDEQLGTDKAGRVEGDHISNAMLQSLIKEKEMIETDLSLKQREYHIHLAKLESFRDALYDPNKELKDDEDE